MNLEPLEPRLTPSADWRSLPVYAEPMPVVESAPADTAAYSLIGAPQERRDYGLSGSGYSVAIIDTGIDYRNPALASRFVGGWDFVNNDSDPLDDNGHGTHVAGIIGSADAVYAGVAPDAGIIALKVLGADGSGTYGNVESALAWVADHQAQYHIAAVNMSLGSGNYATNPWTFLDADLQKLNAEGVFVSCASGNGYFANHSQPGLAFPAVDPLVVSVGAVWAGDYGAASWANGAKDYTTGADQITAFTQRDDKLDLLAPGAYVTSTYLNGAFASLAGTSMASPMACGAAVLVKQALDSQGEPSDQAAVLKVLQSTGVEVTDSAESPAQDNVTHTGLSFSRIDVNAAVASVLPPPLTPNEQYVTDLYVSILGRKPEAAGLAFWAGQLDKGLSREAAVDAVWNSPEHFADLVNADYKAILGRSVDAGGEAWWVGLMQHGATDADVQRSLYASDEFYREHK